MKHHLKKQLQHEGSLAVCMRSQWDEYPGKESRMCVQARPSRPRWRSCRGSCFFGFVHVASAVPPALLRSRKCWCWRWPALRLRSHPRYGAPRVSSKVEDDCRFWSPSAALPHEYFRIAIQEEWRCAPADNPQRQVRRRSRQRLFRGSQCSFAAMAFSWILVWWRRFLLLSDGRSGDGGG